MKLLRIEHASDGIHKLKAVFEIDGKLKTVSFGAKGYSDMTQHKDEERKKRYIARHSALENWSDPTARGTLSRYILWNKPTLSASISDFKRRFHV
jgi:hypothetical protein